MLSRENIYLFCISILFRIDPTYELDAIATTSVQEGPLQIMNDQPDGVTVSHTDQHLSTKVSNIHAECWHLIVDILCNITTNVRWQRWHPNVCTTES
jgi:hypothetical protein